MNPQLIAAFIQLPAAVAFIPHHQSSLSTTNSKMTDNDVTEQQRAKSAFKYVEDVAPGLRLEMELHSIYHTSISEFQQVQVIDSYFGRTLVTDGKTQSAEHDEFVYHESMVQKDARKEIYMHF